MKIILSLATALLFTLSALAMDSQPMELSFSPGLAQAQVDQVYSYSFGTTRVGFPLYTDFTLTNRGVVNLAVNSVGIGGIDFDAYHTCPAVLAPAAVCTIRVRFNPWNEGFKTGRVVIQTSDGMIRINLSGWAQRY